MRTRGGVVRVVRDSQNFQGRYIMQHPFKGDTRCPAGKQYLEGVFARQVKEAATLADLTGWEASDIRKKMKLDEKKPKADGTWYKDLWK